MIKKLLLTACSIIVSLGLTQSVSAVELNSTNITQAPFNCPTNDTFCNLSNQGITSIASGTFVNHSALTSLSLGYNQITSIESGDFDGLSALTSLILFNNQITSIESGDFDGLSVLTSLSLGYNQITSIENGDFDGLSALTYLDLQANQITSIESGDFDGLSSLQELYLGSNQITSIESGSFQGLSALTRLFLDSNQITSIESGDFQGLSALTFLFLDSNRITSIESGDFNGLSSLTFLFLDSNRITSIESGDFNGLSSLSRLRLSSNCFNNEDTSITTYLDGVGGGNANYSNQHVCLIVDYSPSTNTAGSVTGSLVLRGPTSKVATILTDNTMSTYDHVFTGNSSFLFDYTNILDTSNVLWKNNVFTSNGTPFPKTTTGTVTRIIPDTTAPVVTLSGSSTVSLSVGTPYIELGATWTDNVDGSGVIMSASSGTVSTSVPGSYVLSYTYIDMVGNTGNTVIRTVQVIAPTPSGGGGGGAVGLVMDRCPVGEDYSPSYYDRTCGTKPVITTTRGIVRTTSTGSIVQTTGSTLLIVKPTLPIEESSSTAIPKAQQQAYEWALSQGITTAPSLEAAKLDTKITRAQLAKMVSVYATTVGGKQPVGDTRECVFEDERRANADLVPYMRQACQLQIMGIESDGTPLTDFQPNSYVTRAEFGTVLSRILYGQTYNTTGDKRREGHLQKLKTNNIITVIDPTLVELRGWIMVMLYRTQ